MCAKICFSMYKPLKFILSGGSSLLVLLTLLWLLHEKAGLPAVAASTIAYSFSFIVGFLMQKFWTFSTGTERFGRHFLLYMTIALFNVGANAALMYVAIHLLSIWYLLSQVIVAGIIAMWSYLLYQRVFAASSAQEVKTPQN